jgi:hypothetical protein
MRQVDAKTTRRKREEREVHCVAFRGTNVSIYRERVGQKGFFRCSKKKKEIGLL